jgi:hypothetical protein
MAVFADRDIGRDEGKRRIGGRVCALTNDKFKISVIRKGGYGYIGDAGKRRCLGPESFGKLGKPLSFDFDQDPLARVGHVAPEVEGPGKVVDERPEAHALNNAPDAD